MTDVRGAGTGSVIEKKKKTEALHSYDYFPVFHTTHSSTNSNNSGVNSSNGGQSVASDGGGGGRYRSHFF